MRNAAVLMKAVGKAVGAVIISGAPLIAFAQGTAADSGWFGGLSLGQAKVSIDNSGTAPAGVTFSHTKDEKDTAYKVFGGYQFNKNFAVEGGYADFGNHSLTVSITAPTIADGSIKGSAEASGFNVDAVGIIPLQSGFSLFGKVGAVYTTTKGSYTGSGAYTSAVLATAFGDLNPKSSEWNLKWGVGAKYDFTNNMALRVEYERINNVGDKNKVGESDVDMWSLGLVVRF